MTHETWRDRLSEYVDGELSAAEREAADRHVSQCVECRAAVDELRRVIARAGALDDRAPECDLWTGITSRLESPPGVADLERRRPRRRVSFSVPQLLAAGLALMLLSAGSVWLLLAPGSAPVAATTAVNSPVGEAAVAAAMPGYQAAASDLQRVLADLRDRLDPETVRVIEENLAVIDRAIEEAQTALAQDPANPFLNQHLAENMWRKVRLLRQATEIATAAS